MLRKLTIAVHEEVYAALHRVAGRRRISHFLENLANQHLLNHNLEAEYREMAQDKQREAEATEWSQGC